MPSPVGHVRWRHLCAPCIKGKRLRAVVEVLSFQNGSGCKTTELQPEAARDLAWGPTLVWVRLEGIEPKKLESLGAVFNLHPLALEDVQSHRQRPKVEDYPDLTFVVARAPRWNEQKDEMSWLTVGIFLGPDFLITVCTDPVEELDHVQRKLMTGKAGPKNSTIDHVFYQILDSIVDAYFPLMDQLEDRIENLEEGVLAGPDQDEIDQIQNFKRIVSRIRKTVFPMREAMVALEKGDHPNIRDETCIYLRDVADHTTRLAERLDHVKEVAVVAHESYYAALQSQTNRIVKVLAGITFVVTVPMLMGTFFGMNSPQMPDWPWWFVTGGLVASMVPLYLLARKWDWL